MPPKLHRTRGSDIMKYKTTTVSFWSRKFDVEWPLPLVLILVRGLRPITQHKEQKMKSIVLLIVASLSSQTCLGVKYEPNWNSIDSRPLPAWYDDVKIGMFINWGVYSVPSYSNEWFWYSWKGPKPDPRVVKLMEQFYPPTFTYADFAAEFKAEFYDPVKWVDIIKSSGAKWVSPVMTFAGSLFGDLNLIYTVTMTCFSELTCFTRLRVRIVRKLHFSEAWGVVQG